MALRWGLIGCGDIARRNVAPALRDLPNCELVAVSRANYEKAGLFATEFGARKWYEHWQDLIADEEIDAVYVATPVHLHAAQTIAAAEAGKHVLCEKPMAMNVGECDRMIAACQAHQVKLGIAYYRHFYPAIARIKEILAAGEIGQTIIAQINAFELFNPQTGHPRRWLMQKKQSGGGPMFDFGCHRIEILMNLFGAISDTRGKLLNILFDREVEDSGVAFFQFASDPCAVLTVTHAAYERQDTLDIFGSRGSIHVAILNEGKLSVKTADGERLEAHPPASNVHQPLINDFAQAVLEGRNPLVTGEMGREVARIEEEISRFS
jgi:predicted dehydrogenase